MAEPEVATKAPESDAQEDKPTEATGTEGSIFPNDSVAQSGPSMGEHCVTDRPLPADQQPSGSLTQYSGIDVYVSKPSDYPHSPSRLLLLLTGGTGVHSINNQLQADKYASEGYVVVMPDQFSGDIAPTAATDPNEVAPATPSIIERLKLGFAETAKSFMIDMWLARHTPEKVLPILHKVLETARDEFADAVANGGGVYAVGYCFGAKYVLILAGENAESTVLGQPKEEADEEEAMVKSGPVIKAGAIAHATLVEKKDLTSLKAPVTMVCVENDQLFPAEILEAGREYLESNNVKHEIKVFPEVPHGFAVVGDYSDSSIQNAQGIAFDQMINWLKAH
ncbi:putative dienelactone hydrolase family protein [Phaeomoniella chlamydospora]|uniref:Putative dienelactone hydrolase family protein n=1 Tax=Phaeomoniella chlamydospora TaxID=158046 RepID=A0A0G2E044_PHACM|nr:putative dienelactone hydrolase family protein [Phaeomoniella chlamydospora]